MATLITSILTGKVAKAFRTKVPEIGYFSTDFGMDGGLFAAPVKFGQAVLSHLITTPTAEAFTPGGGMGTNAQNPKDLISDVEVKIDAAAKVSLKLPAVDAEKYILGPAFQKTMEEAAIALGRYVVDLAIRKATKNNFSVEKVGTLAAVEYETLSDTRAALNKQGAKAPRFVLGETDWVKQLSRDPVIISGEYHGQLTAADPYITLTNIEGFEQVREWPNMPTGNVAVGAATVANTGDLLTLAAHGLAEGTRIRLTGTLPAGLALATDYFVKGATTNTFQVALTAGGAAVNITADGAATVSKFEALNALAFERRAIHIAFRQLQDASATARALGIPETSRKETVTDPESGLSMTWHFWEDTTGTNPTGDVYATAIVAFGIRAGRELVSLTAPGEQTAGSGMDYAAIRIVENAAS